jgi:hypothetical protein
MIRLGLLTIALLSGSYALQHSGLGYLVHAHVMYIIGFQAVMAVIAHFVGQQGMKDKQQAYTYFMGASMMRLLFSLATLTVYLFMYEQGKNGIITATFNFLVIYIIYAVMEIATFLSNLRRGSAHQTIL